MKATHGGIAMLVSLALLVPAGVRAEDVTVDGFVFDGADLVGGELADLDLFLDLILQGFLTQGTTRLLLEVRDLDDESYEDDEDIEIAFYIGEDQDDDVEDDFDGDDAFEVDPFTVGSDGEPLFSLSDGEIVDGAFSTESLTLDLGAVEFDDFDWGDFDLGDFADLSVGDLIGEIVIEDVSISGTFEDDGDWLASDAIEAAIPADLLESIEAPPPADLLFDNLLEWVTDDSIFGLGAEADVDLDDDGENDAFSLEFELTAVSAQIVRPAQVQVGTDMFLRGDVDGDGTTEAIGDAVFLLLWEFAEGSTPPCMDAADIDDSGSISSLVDALVLLRWGFSEGTPPADPGPLACGFDPSDTDDLTCDSPLDDECQ